jgi:hypothetical protein
MQQIFRSLIFGLFLLQFSAISAQETGADVVKMIFERHNGKWAATRSFQQKTIFYKNDVETDSTIWHEAIRFPDKLRIDFDSLTSGRAVIFTRDSAFTFKENKLQKSYRDPNDLLFLLGGMHFMPLDSVMKKMAEFQFDPTQPVRSAGFKNKTCWIIGDVKKGGNEVWIEQKKLLPMRILKQTEGTNDEIWLENYVRLAQGWCEGKVTFYQDGHIVQLEKYDQIRSGNEIDASVFEPRKFRTRK